MSSSLIQVATADLAHLVERHLAKVEVASSSLVIRSIFSLYILVVSAKVGACASSDYRENIHGAIAKW